MLNGLKGAVLSIELKLLEQEKSYFALHSSFHHELLEPLASQEGLNLALNFDDRGDFFVLSFPDQMRVSHFSELLLYPHHCNLFFLKGLLFGFTFSLASILEEAFFDELL